MSFEYFLSFFTTRDRKNTGEHEIPAIPCATSHSIPFLTDFRYCELTSRLWFNFKIFLNFNENVNSLIQFFSL